MAGSCNLSTQLWTGSKLFTFLSNLRWIRFRLDGLCLFAGVLVALFRPQHARKHHLCRPWGAAVRRSQGILRFAAHRNDLVARIVPKPRAMNHNDLFSLTLLSEAWGQPTPPLRAHSSSSASLRRGGCIDLCAVRWVSACIVASLFF